MSKHKILQPLLYSEQVLYPLPYNDVTNHNRFYTKADLFQFYNNISDCQNVNIVDLTCLNFINEYGYVTPLNKSIIKLTWESCKYVKNKKEVEDSKEPPEIPAAWKKKKLNIKYKKSCPSMGNKLFYKKKTYSSNNDGW